MLNPVNGYIIIEPQEDQETFAGNIIIPDLGKEKPATGKVVAVSDFYNFATGQVVPCSITVGDDVLIPKMGSQKTTYKGKEYYICKSVEVIAIIE